MSPRHGIENPGAAFLFSSVTTTISHRYAPMSRLDRRRTKAGQITNIIIIVLVAVAVLFCAVLLFIILNNKRRRRRRQQKLDQTQPLAVHEYRQLDDMESTRNMPQELPSGDQFKNHSVFERAELQSDENEVPKVPQLDGKPAPHNASFAPVELPTDAHTPNTSKAS